MADVKEQLRSAEQKYKRFIQQQFIFIKALERSREHARDRTEPVSTVAQVQRYMIHHCSNSTDRSIFSLFLEIIADLCNVLKQIDSTISRRNTSSEELATCRELLGPNSDISNLRADYPHSVINRLSCDEARNFYGGIVSVIPLALDVLTTTKGGSRQPTPSVTERSPDAAAKNTHLDGATSRRQRRNKGSGGWHAGKPAWKPPGNASK